MRKLGIILDRNIAGTSLNISSARGKNMPQIEAIISLPQLYRFCFTMANFQVGIGNEEGDISEKLYPIFVTRSVGALRAPISSWRPLGPLD